MTGKVSARAKTTKSGTPQKRGSIPPNRGSISPVMQKVKSLLPERKAAQHLAILLDWDVKRCEKLLSGERRENGDEKEQLLQSDFGRDVLFVIMGGARPEWFSKYQKQLDVIDAHRALKETAKKVDQIRAEVFS